MTKEEYSALSIYVLNIIIGRYVNANNNLTDEDKKINGKIRNEDKFLFPQEYELKKLLEYIYFVGNSKPILHECTGDYLTDCDKDIFKLMADYNLFDATYELAPDIKKQEENLDKDKMSARTLAEMISRISYKYPYTRWTLTKLYKKLPDEKLFEIFDSYKDKFYLTYVLVWMDSIINYSKGDDFWWRNNIWRMEDCLQNYPLNGHIILNENDFIKTATSGKNLVGNESLHRDFLLEDQHIEPFYWVDDIMDIINNVDINVLADNFNEIFYNSDLLKSTNSNPIEQEKKIVERIRKIK